MGLRAKVVFGLVLFFVIFGLRFLCANCQQVEMDLRSSVGSSSISSNSKLQHHQEQWEVVTTRHSTFSDWDGFNQGELSPNPYDSWLNNEPPLRRRRPGIRKRKRRPQAAYTTESSGQSYDWRADFVDDEYNTTPLNNKFPDLSSSQSKLQPPRIPKVPNINNQKLMNQQSPSITRKHHFRNEKIREPMAALERDQQLYEIRERQKLALTTESPSTMKNNKSYRKPYSQGRREKIEENTKELDQSKPTSDLKNILKNSGSLSLSEILQQKNLSLDDLLKGKQNALLALQTTQSPTSPIIEPIKNFSKAERRIPLLLPSSKIRRVKVETIENKALETASSGSSLNASKSRKGIKTTFENIPTKTETQSEEITTIITTINEDLSLQSILNDTNPVSKNQADLATGSSTKDPTILDEETTTIELSPVNIKDESNTSTQKVRPSFVPQYRRRPVIKPRANQTHSHFPFSSSSSSSSPSPSSLSSSSSSLSSLSQSSTSSESSSEYVNSKLEKGKGEEIFDSSSTSVEHKLKEILPDDNLVENNFPFNSLEKNNFFTTTLEELFSSQNLSRRKNQSTLSITSRIDQNNQQTTPSSKGDIDITETNPSLFLDITSDKPVDDRTDLLELIEDRRSGGRLFKVLAQRNMTLEELLEHRRRGSSQLHLAEILQNKSQPFLETPRISSPFDESLDIVTAFENFPHFNLANLKSVNPDEIKTDSEGSSYFTSIINIVPTDEVHRESKSADFALSQSILPQNQPSSNISALTSNLNGKIDLNTSKDLLSASLTSQENSIDFKHSNEPEKLTFNHLPSKNHNDNNEDTISKIEDEVARAHDLLDLELSGHGFKRSTVSIENAEMSTGVRSAIVASSAIVAIFLILFLVIFMVCRSKQKQRNKLSYLDTYATIKTRLPIISRQTAMKRISENSSPIIFPNTKNNYKINTMDPNSPEVQEYLFDTIRKSSF